MLAVYVQMCSFKIGNLYVDVVEKLLIFCQQRLRIVKMFQNMGKDEHIESPVIFLQKFFGIVTNKVDACGRIPLDCLINKSCIIVNACYMACMFGNQESQFAGIAAKIEDIVFLRQMFFQKR